MSLRAERVAIAQRLRADGGGGEGLGIVAIAREMGISVSYVSSLLTDPTGEIDRARKRKYHKPKPKGKRKRKWTKPLVIEAIQEWDRAHGRPPFSHEWVSNANLPNRVPSTRAVYNLFGKGGWNKAIEAAGFTPRPPHAPEYTQNTASDRPTPMRPEIREAMSEERKALYAANPDHPMFRGLQEGWDIREQQRQRGLRRHAARQQRAR
jgi:hypothetical protein